jgi:endonuclease/exonuclease/phosphatase family metal-dependent hydrolase
MRVLTLNIWGRRGDWDTRRAVILQGLRDLRPDLVAFQEAVVDEEYDQVSDLLGPGFHLAHQAEREPGEEGVERGQGTSIASRWPVEDVREVGLQVTPRTAGFACTTLIAQIDAPVGSLLFANHVPSWQLQFERERELQALAAARALEELEADHVVLAGDLTSDPEAANVRFLCGRQSLEGVSVCYRDAWESVHGAQVGETFTPRNPLVSDWDWPFRRLDYILVRCGEHGGPTLEITGCDLVFDEPVDGIWASDHFGVVADLEPPAPRVHED